MRAQIGIFRAGLNTGSHHDWMASRRAADPLSTKEEGCRSAKFGTIIHRHHLLVSGIARKGWFYHRMRFKYHIERIECQWDASSLIYN
jgi:hypothetical protein